MLYLPAQGLHGQINNNNNNNNSLFAVSQHSSYTSVNLPTKEI